MVGDLVDLFEVLDKAGGDAHQQQQHEPGFVHGL